MSPNSNSNSNNVWNVNSTGNAGNNNANNAGGVRPISLKHYGLWTKVSHKEKLWEQVLFLVIR